MKVLVSSTPMALWHEVLHEAESACSTTLTHELEAYLVLLLLRYTNKPEMGKKIMATDLMLGLNQGAQQRDLALQGVGDTCLLFSGLFPGIAEKRLVKISYFINIGRGAYIAISKSNDFFSMLAQQFVSIMDILQCIRKHANDFPDLSPFQAYDLWNVLKQYTHANPIASYMNHDPCIIHAKK
jgi:hypothetical protein